MSHRDRPLRGVAGRRVIDRRARRTASASLSQSASSAHPRMIVMGYPAGVIAMTRSGLPLPLTIFSGAAITIAPVGGN